MSAITERETPHGYWWRYSHSDGEPADTLTAVIMIAREVAASEARRRGKTYVVARGRPAAPTPSMSSRATILTRAMPRST